MRNARHLRAGLLPLSKYLPLPGLQASLPGPALRGSEEQALTTAMRISRPISTRITSPNLYTHTEMTDSGCPTSEYVCGMPGTVSQLNTKLALQDLPNRIPGFALYGLHPLSVPVFTSADEWDFPGATGSRYREY